jgi:hypothetical protein
MMKEKQRRKEKIVWDSRRQMMVALGIEIIVYGVFAAAIIYELIGAYALSSLHDPSNYLAFLAVLWPLFELVLSWTWLARTRQYAENKFLATGNTLALTASMLAPILGYVVLKSGIDSITVPLWIMIGIPLVGHWTARLLWLKRKTDAGITQSVQ